MPHLRPLHSDGNSKRHAPCPSRYGRLLGIAAWLTVSNLTAGDRSANEAQPSDPLICLAVPSNGGKSATLLLEELQRIQLNERDSSVRVGTIRDLILGSWCDPHDHSGISKTIQDAVELLDTSSLEDLLALLTLHIPNNGDDDYENWCFFVLEVAAGRNSLSRNETRSLLRQKLEDRVRVAGCDSDAGLGQDYEKRLNTVRVRGDLIDSLCPDIKLAWCSDGATQNSLRSKLSDDSLTCMFVFSTNCNACRPFWPHLQTLQDREWISKVKFLGIAIDSGDVDFDQQLTSYITKNDIAIPIVSVKWRDAYDSLVVDALPHLIICDSNQAVQFSDFMHAPSLDGFETIIKNNVNRDSRSAP